MFELTRFYCISFTVKDAPIDNKVLHAFSTLVQLYGDGRCTYSCFPRVFYYQYYEQQSVSHLLLFHISRIERIVGGERRMNPVAMTNNKPQKEYWLNRRFEPATSCLSVLGNK